MEEEEEEGVVGLVMVVGVREGIITGGNMDEGGTTAGNNTPS